MTRPAFEALGHAETPGGVLRLWRRFDVALDTDVYEVKLGDEYLMTSLFPQTEIALAELALDRLDGDGLLDVVVGGLGLGFTAMRVLEDDRVGALVVVEFTQAVIDWQVEGLLPGADELTGDARTRLVQGDFFTMAESEDGLDPDQPGRRWDAIVVDIDHTPEHHLDQAPRSLYTTPGLERLATHLVPGGVFALWSDGLPIDDFTAVLGEVFLDAEARVVTFDNVLTGTPSHATIYLGTTPS